MRRLGRWGYRAALVVLPAWLRERVGADMLRTFDERQDDAVARGGPVAPLSLLALWLREITDVTRIAYRSRRPDARSRRTASPEVTSRPGPIIDHLRSDVRFALRTFVRRPGMALLAILTLSLGIGSSTAMFSIVDSVLLRPLPYPDPDRIVRVYPTWPELIGHPTLGDLALRGTWSWPELWLVDEQQDVFDGIGAYSGTEVTLGRDGQRPERLAAGMGGVGIGLVGVWASSRMLAGVVYGIRALDVPTLLAGCLTLGLVAVAASTLLALRAVRVSPVLALRVD